MIIVDANILLYAYDADSPHHDRARSWLERSLSKEPDVRIGLTSILAFLRIGTDPRVFAQPLEPAWAVATVQSWLARSNVAVALPGDGHWAVVAKLAAAGKARGSMLMDAHLAALALEHGATLATSDRDFARFPRLRIVDPLTD
jgi:toxin-antitoxin system PIN domain toxin